MGEQVIVLTDLTKQYGNFTAVDHIRLNIRKGEIFGLLGPNGAGKSTTILMMLGLTEPTSGTVEICGINSTTHPIEVKRKIGYLPEDVGFYDDMTGPENLIYTARLNGISDKEAKTKAMELMKRVGLEDQLAKKTGKYSRGMRQRLGLADVLIKNPEIIILDEPTSGIDPAGVQEFIELIRWLSKEEGLTVLFSSHHLDQVQKVCDRVGLFSNGQLLALIDMAELKDKKSSGSNTGESGDDVYLKDGWYRLKIYAEDLVGNQEEQEICFAVNRSGPKLTTDASMQKFLKQKTAQQGQKLKLRVWDVNKMQKEELQCIFDGKARNLEEGKDYQKRNRQTAEGFMEYDYELAETVFEKEGRYSLKLFLEDEAGHQLPEKEKILCRDFAIDRTPPICVIDPIKATEKGFQVQTICEDNVDFAKIWLCKNGSLYKESKNPESSWEISFGHEEKWQLEVFDTAGNKEVRYLLKEELEKELERKKLLPEKKGKHKNRIFETQKQTENGTHGEKQKKAGFLQKETNSLSNEPERQEQEKDRDEGQMTVTVVFIVLSGLSGMLYWVKHRQKVQI